MVSMRIRSTRPSIRSDDAVLHAGETRLAEHSDLYRGPQRIYSATRGRKLRWSPCASVQLAQVSRRVRAAECGKGTQEVGTRSQEFHYRDYSVRDRRA